MSFGVADGLIDAETVRMIGLGLGLAWLLLFSLIASGLIQWPLQIGLHEGGMIPWNAQSQPSPMQ